MILGFKNQFVTPIISGKKIHTIRKDEKNRWQAGRTIHFATGARTKNYKQFKIGLCYSVQPIRIVNHGNHIFVRVDIDDNKYIHNDCIDYDDNRLHDIYLLDKIIENDGLIFHNFINWFIPVEGNIFIGKIIHWTNYLYA